MTSEAPERIWTIDLDGTGSMHPSCRGDDGAVEYVRADLSPQWRPISEVKPNVLVDVWVVAKRRSESGRYVNMRLLDNGQWFGPQRLYPSDKITHFMPLPEAPK